MFLGCRILEEERDREEGDVDALVNRADEFRKIP